MGEVFYIRLLLRNKLHWLGACGRGLLRWPGAYHLVGVIASVTLSFGVIAS